MTFDKSLYSTKNGESDWKKRAVKAKQFFYGWDNTR